MTARSTKSDDGVLMSDEPVTLASRVVDVAMRVAHEHAEESGAEILSMFVAVDMRGQPEGEVGDVCSASGTEISPDVEVSHRQLLGILLGHARVIGRVMGYEVKLVAVRPERRG